MARHRTIEEDTILDSAERVIIENGAANFTLDAVAACAGISKGSVVRDYGTKQDLIRAIVRRRFNEYQAMLDDAERAQPAQGPQARIAAHVELACLPLPEEQRVAASQLCYSLANDRQLTDIITAHYQREIEAVSAPGVNSGALLALLALEGIKSIELFGSHKWPDAERERLLARIAKLANSDVGGGA